MSKMVEGVAKALMGYQQEEKLSDYYGMARVAIEAAGEIHEAEIKRLRIAGAKYLRWIENLYGDLPIDRPPGPPKQLLKEMYADFVDEQSGEKK